MSRYWEHEVQRQGQKSYRDSGSEDREPQVGDVVVKPVMPDHPGAARTQLRCTIDRMWGLARSMNRRDSVQTARIWQAASAFKLVELRPRGGVLMKVEVHGGTYWTESIDFV